MQYDEKPIKKPIKNCFECSGYEGTCPVYTPRRGNRCFWRSIADKDLEAHRKGGETLLTKMLYEFKGKKAKRNI